MQDIKYLFPKRSDIYYIALISFVLSLLFSILSMKLSRIQIDFTHIFFSFFIMLNIMHHLKLFFMKLMGLKNGVEVEIELSNFSQYGPRPYDKMNQTFDIFGFIKTIPKAGLSTITISILLYILTLGFFIYPSIYKYKFIKIKHLLMGAPQHHELQATYTRPFEVTDHRISKIYVVGFFFYFVFAQFVELLLKDSEIYPWLIGAVFYIALFTIVAIPGNEGFELYKRDAFGYPILLTILFIGMLSILVFDNVLFTSLVLGFSFLYIYFDKQWKKLSSSSGH